MFALYKSLAKRQIVPADTSYDRLSPFKKPFLGRLLLSIAS